MATPLLARLARRPSVDIDFEDIYFTAGGKRILNGLSGGFKAGEVTAVMGPSGAGKSTLLNVIAGYVTSGVSGCIYTNGEARRMNVFNKLSTYIMQEDMLEPLLTVREAMTLAAKLKVGDEMSNPEKAAAIEELLSTLGLMTCIDTYTEQLSGGQRKRVSIALELVNNPPVLFLDEPTTGLDVVSINQLVGMLSVLASQGRTVVCTIHQPSATTFSQFDSVYMMAGGRSFYRGHPSSLVPFLSEAGLCCPPTHNPADFVFEVLEPGTINMMSGMIHNGKANRAGSPKRMHLSTQSSLLSKKSLEELPQALGPSSKLTYPTSFFTQFRLLLVLMWTQKLRNPTGLYILLIHHVLSGLLVGAIFMGVGSSASRPVDNFKFCVCTCVFYMYTHAMTSVVHYPIEIKIMKREFFNRWYSLKAYFSAKTISSTPFIVVLGWIFLLITYLMTDQPLEWRRFLWFALISTFLGVISDGLGQVIGFNFNCTNGSVICPLVMAPILMLAFQGMGFGESLSEITRYIMKLSYLRYAVVGIVTALYLDGRQMTCDEDDIYCFYKDPRMLVRDLGMSGQETLPSMFGLFFYFILFRFLAYLSLSYRVNTDFSLQMFSYLHKIAKRKK